MTSSHLCLVSRFLIISHTGALKKEREENVKIIIYDANESQLKIS